MTHQANVTSVAFSPDGKLVLTRGNTKTAWLWNTAGQPIGQPMMHPGEVYAVAFSPDSQTVASGCADGMVRVWDAAGAQELHALRGSGSRVVSVAFDGSGKTLAALLGDGTAWIWDPHEEHTVSFTDPQG